MSLPPIDLTEGSPEGVREHVFRASLPWRRDGGLTECGLPGISYPTLTREAMRAKIERQGERRASLSSCMTCWEAMGRRYASPVVKDDLIDVLEREIQRARWKERATTPLHRELRAIVALIEAHRDEFDAIVKDFEQYERDAREAVSIESARRKSRSGVS